jgi:hypothetical protein
MPDEPEALTPDAIRISPLSRRVPSLAPLEIDTNPLEAPVLRPLPTITAPPIDVPLLSPLEMMIEAPAETPLEPPVTWTSPASAPLAFPLPTKIDPDTAPLVTPLIN